LSKSLDQMGEENLWILCDYYNTLFWRYLIL
jgi:hypothetical protein